MVECAVCGPDNSTPFPYLCERCGLSHCSNHRLPENHSCGSHEITEEDWELVESGSSWTGMLLSILTFPLALVVLGISYAFGLASRLASLVTSPIGVLVLALVLSVGAYGVVGDDLRDFPGDGISSILSDDQINLTETERLTHEFVNEERAERGVHELEWSETLHGLASDHSADMAEHDHYSHSSSDGHSFQMRYFGMGMFCVPGENINYALVNQRYAQHWDNQTIRISDEEELAEYLVESWMQSDEHRENLLNTRYSSQAIGLAETSSGEVYATQSFC